MEHKTIPCFLKQTDDQGVVECIFAVFGNIDEGKDILHPGSFKKTLTERGGKVRILDQHNTDSISRVLGKPKDIREISGRDLPPELKTEYPNATGGVWAKIQFFLDTPEGKGAFVRLKEGGIDEWSFGYDAIDTDFTTVTTDGDKYQVRNLRTVKLFEISPVLWGMNPATSTLDAKDTEEEMDCKAVTSYQNLDLGPRNRAWDSDAAEARVRAWAGGIDDMDWEKYRKAFLWYDSENQDVFQGYKLPYADVIGGELLAIPRGVFAVAGSLQGAREEPDISDADADGVKRNVERYYAKMSDEFDDVTLIAPWNKAVPGPGSGGDADEPGASGEEDAPMKSGGAISLSFNMPDDFDPNEFEKTFADALRAAGLTIKDERKGRNLSKLLNDRIDELVTDDRSRSNIIAEMGKSFGSTSAIVNQILDGSIDCLTEHRAEAFAEVLEIPLSRINDALKADGCMSEESAADDPVEAKEGKSMGNSRLGDVLQGNLHYAFTCLVDKWYIQSYMDRDERLLLSSLIGDALDVLDTGIPVGLADRDVSYGPIYADSYYYALTPDIEEKAGRVLSAANAQKLQAALAQLNEVLMAAGMLAEPDESSAQHEDEEDEDEKAKANQLLNLVELEQQEISSMHLF